MPRNLLHIPFKLSFDTLLGSANNTLSLPKTSINIDFMSSLRVKIRRRDSGVIFLFSSKVLAITCFALCILALGVDHLEIISCVVVDCPVRVIIDLLKNISPSVFRSLLTESIAVDFSRQIGLSVMVIAWSNNSGAVNAAFTLPCK